MPDDKPTYWYQDQEMDIDEYREEVNESYLVCDECGCPEIEEKCMEWRKVNTGEFVDTGEGDGSYWCPYCDGGTDDQTQNVREWLDETEEKFFVKEGEQNERPMEKA